MNKTLGRLTMLAKSMSMRLYHLAPAVTGALWRRGWRIALHARLAQLETQSAIPAISLGDLLGNDASSIEDLVIKLNPALDAGGDPASTVWLETLILSFLVKLVQPQAILEIGTFRGRTTWHLFHNAPPDASLYTMDLPDALVPGNITDMRLAASKERPCVPVSERVHRLLLDSREWDGSLPERIQFAFLDASHRYDDVKNDTEKAMMCMDEAACICWHDSLWKDNDYGVYRYIAELRAQGYKVFRIQRELEYSSLAIWLSPPLAERLGISVP